MKIKKNKNNFYKKEKKKGEKIAENHWEWRHQGRPAYIYKVQALKSTLEEQTYLITVVTSLPGCFSTISFLSEI